MTEYNGMIREFFYLYSRRILFIQEVNQLAASADQHAHRPMFWYPKVYRHSDSKFIYLDTLEADQPGVYKEAQNLLSQALSEDKIAYDLSSLQALMQREEAKEDQFLNEHFGVSSTSPRQDAERISAFNKIYQMESVFARNIEKIKAVAEGSKQGKIDITQVFRSYLEQEFNKYTAETSLDDLSDEGIKEVVKKALHRAYNSRDDRMMDEETATRSYQELVQVIDAMSAQDPLIQDVFDLYFGTTIDQIKLALTEDKTTKSGKQLTNAQKAIKQGKTLHGNLLEITSAFIANYLQSNVNGPNIQWTGQGKQKADLAQIIGSFEAELPTSEATIDGSIREQMVNKMEKFYDNLKEEKGYIVEISAKNYDLATPYFKDGGFAAQGATTIENFERTMNAFGYDQDRVDALVYALINIGPDTLTNDNVEICRQISTLIGYFLFDDINMDLGGNVKGIHLFNLGGVYVPLSAFLKKAYQSIKTYQGSPSTYVKVSYNPQSTNYQKQEQLEYSHWAKQVDIKKKQSGLSIHFFQDFTQYIASLF